MKLGSKLGANNQSGIAFQANGDKHIAFAAFQQFQTYVSSGKAADSVR